MKSLRKVDLVENVAMIAVIAITLCICILPHKVLTDFGDEVMPFVGRGCEAAYSGDWAAAKSEATEVLSIVERCEQWLCVIVDHRHVAELLRVAETAVEAALLEDKSLYQEMMTVITGKIEEIQQTEKMSLSMLF